MAYPTKIKKKKIGGVKVTAKCFKRNLRVYKDIGGKVWIHGRKRKWKKKGVDVHLTNYYFIRDPRTTGANPLPVLVATGPASFHNKRNNVHKHFAFGIGVKVKFDGTPTVGPVQGPVSMPLIGVISRAVVQIGGEAREFITQKGTVPDNFQL
ncbi:uncharacterized protein SOCE26_018740 [Sorangium cellulosum]|uniref:Uncharacterized protein n=1 Tax=Sorangium cellulosum TaxID=56 RepID=A0A2L0EME1_SORCE|nr:hypothetical protein [Sorangium cellulosum]AUX40473.1 uncharacterized protein SOCE26_018740 [Sorangium cellulosum]